MLTVHAAQGELERGYLQSQGDRKDTPGLTWMDGWVGGWWVGEWVDGWVKD